MRTALATALGMDPGEDPIHQQSGTDRRSAPLGLPPERFYPLIAHLAKETGRPVKVMLREGPGARATR